MTELATSSQISVPNGGFSLLMRAAAVAIKSLPGFLTRHWTWIVPLHLLAFFVEQGLLLNDDAVAAGQGDGLGPLAAAASLKMSFDLAWYAIFFALAIRAQTALEREEPFDAFQTLAENVAPLMIENLRVLARVIFWLPFFILPAVYHYLRLSFVSFVVVADPLYPEGRRDAIRRSRQLTSGRLLTTIGAIYLALVFEPALKLLIVGSDGALWRNPLGALVALPLSILCNLWSVSFLYHVYRALASRLAPESPTQ